ncbi:MAG: hypothetical protein CVU38_08315 [Chloroflexi bacterium HGW-Chloroflexi-1]|nr:MAG: hypothetical protein CVU38_08315 [Chloroflexi bacterium HGW-Chloroflexi-1]
MSVRAWYLLTRNQFMGFLREPAAAIFNLAVPFFIIIVQAFAYGNQPVYAADGTLMKLRVVDVLPVSAATMYVIIIGLFGMAVGLASMADSRMLSTFRLRPGGLASALTAYGAVLLSLTIAGLVLSVAALAIGWRVAFASRPLLLLVLLLASTVTFLGLGACVAAVSPSPRSAQGIASALFFPMLFLSGATYPISGYPRALQVVAEVLPGRHVFELISFAWMPADPFPWASALYVIIACAVLPPLVGWLFARREDL